MRRLLFACAILPALPARAADPPAKSKPQIEAPEDDSDQSDDVARDIDFSAPANGQNVQLEAGAAPSGTYKGVTPGSTNLPPHPPQLPVKGPAKMTWPGFQLRDGMPTVFVEVAGPLDWKVREEKKRLIYTLRNTVVPLRNNRRPLRVGDFGTAVRQVDVRPKKRDVELWIDVKHSVSHIESTEPAAGGFTLLVITLGK